MQQDSRRAPPRRGRARDGRSELLALGDTSPRRTGSQRHWRCREGGRDGMAGGRAPRRLDGVEPELRSRRA
jgi:hypothetical protein